MSTGVAAARAGCARADNLEPVYQLLHRKAGLLLDLERGERIDGQAAPLLRCLLLAPSFEEGGRHLSHAEDVA